MFCVATIYFQQYHRKKEKERKTVRMKERKKVEAKERKNLEGSNKEIINKLHHCQLCYR